MNSSTVTYSFNRPAQGPQAPQVTSPQPPSRPPPPPPWPPKVPSLPRATDGVIFLSNNLYVFHLKKLNNWMSFVLIVFFGFSGWRSSCEYFYCSLHICTSTRSIFTTATSITIVCTIASSDEGYSGNPNIFYVDESNATPGSWNFCAEIGCRYANFLLLDSVGFEKMWQLISLSFYFFKKIQLYPPF